MDRLVIRPSPAMAGSNLNRVGAAMIAGKNRSAHMCKMDEAAKHTHHHTKEEQKAILNRLSKAMGHLQSIKRMIENGRDCSEVLIQLAAVKSAVNNTGKIILKNHLTTCIAQAIMHDDMEQVDEFNRSIDLFMR